MLVVITMAAVALLAMEAAADTMRLSAQHAPLFRSQADEATIRVTAQNAEHGLSTVSIAVTTGTMTDCSEVLDPPSPVPCRADASTTTATCALPQLPTTEIVCEHKFAVASGEIVTYSATAKPVSGPAATTIAITFAWVEPGPGLLAPIWWHAEAMQDDESRDRIRLGLFPDSDYESDYVWFAADVARLVEHVFFNGKDAYSRTYSAYRGVFDLWAAPWGAEAGPGTDLRGNNSRNDVETVDCLMDFPGPVSAPYAYLDGRAILHKTDFRDCASFGPRGEGTVSTEVHSPDAWLLVHESAHFVFGLGDEYAAGGKRSYSEPNNVFDSIPQCDATRAAVGASPDECIVFAIDKSEPQDSRKKLRISLASDEDSNETMERPAYNSDFRDNADLAVRNQFAKCLAGKCF